MSHVDLFTTVHKGLRALINHLNSMLSSADFGNEEATQQMLSQVAHLFEMLHEHAKYEDDTIFAAMAKFEPEMIAKLEAEHGEIGKWGGAVDADVAKVKAATTAQERIAAGAELNKSVNEFIAFYLTHLMHEERTVVPASMQYLSDEELTGMRMTVQRSAGPARFGEWMRWTMPAMNLTELVGMFQGLKQHAPPQMFDGMSQMAAMALGEVRWKAVQDKAGLTASQSA